MGIHYDYKSKRGERAVLRQAKREARLARKKAKRKNTAEEQNSTPTIMHDIQKPITLQDLTNPNNKKSILRVNGEEWNLLSKARERYKVEKKSKYKSLKKLSKSQLKEKKKLINAIKSRVNRGWPTGAVKLLQQRDVKTLLDQVEIDQQKELISKAFIREY